jgi:hypothetical protein
LFYNTPARRKFLKSAQAERRAVVKTITALALAHWEVRWLLRDDGRVLLDLLPNDSLPGRARDLLGGSVMDHMARFELEAGGFAVAGMASRPTWVRGNREQQFLYVNRRSIESSVLSQAVYQAYREVIPPGKHPVVVAFLQVPPGEVDVNVHPAKTEVRLLLERQVFSLLKNALQEGLSLRATEPFGPAKSSAESLSDSAASGGAADNHAVIVLMQLANGTRRIQADIDVRERDIDLKTDPRLPGQVVELFAFRRAMKIDLALQADEVDRRYIRITIPADGGHPSDVGQREDSFNFFGICDFTMLTPHLVLSFQIYQKKGI